ncbi:Nif3-like dinuclear metal center hexameric protein [Cohnella hashimotonis]|uniref:GTP cyclohydrolase 1 type 2 homolog n=1 Tax=Cohnella hashimotonis TaxID=2826895 RepID=A0ABT6THC7_9BACL|nr:Nif3-like dinuclear metal center hexameric protein [Cohnella hashimotonis]MDI4645991.1 Nif3-like dinuclear metal center hexameric protein [Cohnella hashimotonis]
MAITVGQVLDALIAPVGKREDTVDTLKNGNPEEEVRGVAVVFLATYEVIGRAIASGANLIITHEPTYYNHLDETDWLSGDPVYERKRALIESSGVAVFRLHDYIHQYKPDGIVDGMLRALDWEAYADPDKTLMLTLPEDGGRTVRSIADEIKRKLGIDSVMVAGDPELAVTRFGFAVGAPGGRSQMAYLRERDIELLIAGETNEWETNEYVRDAADMGMNKAMIILGHQKSEELGMRTVVKLLRDAFPGLPVDHLELPTALRRI